MVDNDRFEVIVAKYRSHFAASAEFLNGERDLTAARRGMQFAAFTHVDATEAAHETAVHSDVETYAVALFHDSVVFTHPEGTTLDDVVTAYTGVLSNRIRAVTITTSTGMSVAGL